VSPVDNTIVLARSYDVEIVRGEKDYVLVRQKNTGKYLSLNKSQLEILMAFDGMKPIGDVLYSLLHRPNKPSIRAFYDLVFTAQDYEILRPASQVNSVGEDPWVEANFARIRPCVASYLFALFLGVVSVLMVVYYLVPTSLDTGADGVFWFYVPVGISIGLSLSSILMAINLKLWKRRPCRFRVSFSRLIPYLEVDTGDAFMGGRGCEVTTAFIGVTGPMIWGAIVWGVSYLFQPYEMADGVFVIPFSYFGALHLSVWIAILIESSPFGATSMQQLIHAVFRKNYDVPKQASRYLESKFLRHLLRWHEQLTEERYFIAYSSFVIVWLVVAIEFGIKFVLAQYMQLRSEFLLEDTLGLRFYLILGIVVVGFVLLLIPILYILWIFGFGLLREIIKKYTCKEAKWKKAKASGLLPDHEQLVSFLSENILFMDLPRESINNLISYFKLLHIKKGEVLIREGDDGDLLFVLWAGKVDVIKETESGHRSVVATLGRGDIFGEIALLNSSKRTSTVVTTTPVDCLILTRDDFQREVVNKLGAREVEDKIQRAGFLRRTELFSDWNPKSIVMLTSRCKVQDFNDGDLLIQEGHENKYFYLLYEGNLEVYKNQKWVANLEPGKFCGEISLLKNIPATADVKAKGKVRCFVFDKETFLEIVTKDFFTGYMLDEELERRFASK
jgi:cAMP-dependent protein kinase regulator